MSKAAHSRARKEENTRTQLTQSCIGSAAVAGSVSFDFELRECAVERAHDDFLGRDAKTFGLGSQTAVAVGCKEGNRAGSEVPEQKGEGACVVERPGRFGGFDGDVSREVNGEGDARQPHKDGDRDLYGRPWPAPGEGYDVAAVAFSRLG